MLLLNYKPKPCAADTDGKEDFMAKLESLLSSFDGLTATSQEAILECLPIEVICGRLLLSKSVFPTCSIVDFCLSIAILFLDARSFDDIFIYNLYNTSKTCLDVIESIKISDLKENVRQNHNDGERTR